jgi:CubicO group peptidase (beta-lactamase class C family)
MARIRSIRGWRVMVNARVSWALTVLVVVWLVCDTVAAAGDDWAVADPAGAGFAVETLGAVIDAAVDGHANVHAVLVERHGQLVAERYRTGPDTPITVRYGLPNPFASDVAFDAATLHDVRSISKSVVGMLVGIAVARGQFPPLSTPVLDAYPQLADLRTPPRDAITFEQLLTMSSGLEWNEWTAGILTSDETRLFWTPDQVRFVFDRPQAATPGTVFNYDGGGTQTLADQLARTTGTSVAALAGAEIFAPLGITQWEWATDFRGRPLAFAGLRLRPRDLAKLGRLMLDHGRWHGQAIVPEAWVAESLRPHISTGITGLSPSGNVVGYGYQWWTGTEVWNGREIAWAAGVGNGGQRLYVVPELDVTVVMAAGEYGSPQISQTANRLLGGVIAAAR